MTSPPGRLAYPDLDEGVSREVLAQLDEAAPCAEHWKLLITAGMGFSPMPTTCSSSAWAPR
jgi:hypothetical protein